MTIQRTLKIIFRIISNTTTFSWDHNVRAGLDTANVPSSTAAITSSASPVVPVSEATPGAAAQDTGIPSWMSSEYRNANDKSPGVVHQGEKVVALPEETPTDSDWSNDYPMTDALSDLLPNSSSYVLFRVLNPEIDEEYATLYSFLGITDTDIDIIAGTLDIMNRMQNYTKNRNQCSKTIQYGCKLCGNIYSTTDGVRKHCRTKHSNVILRRGHFEDYSWIIHPIET